MANTTTQATNNNAKTKEVGAVESRFTEEIVSNRRFWKPEKSEGKPIIGYLLSLERMPDATQIVKDPVTGEKKNVKKKWHALVVKTTEPTLVVDGEDELGTSTVGEEIYVPLNVDLRKSALNVLVSNALKNEMVEVYIKPKKKQALGGGQTMWLFDTRTNPKSKTARPEGRLVFVDNANPLSLLGKFDGGDATKMLPPGEDLGEEIPF